MKWNERDYLAYAAAAVAIIAIVAILTIVAYVLGTYEMSGKLT